MLAGQKDVTENTTDQTSEPSKKRFFLLFFFFFKLFYWILVWSQLYSSFWLILLRMTFCIYFVFQTSCADDTCWIFFCFFIWRWSALLQSVFLASYLVFLFKYRRVIALILLNFLRTFVMFIPFRRRHFFSFSGECSSFAWGKHFILYFRLYTYFMYRTGKLYVFLDFPIWYTKSLATS